jgi:rubrerythrin
MGRKQKMENKFLHVENAGEDVGWKRTREIITKNMTKWMKGECEMWNGREDWMITELESKRKKKIRRKAKWKCEGWERKEKMAGKMLRGWKECKLETSLQFTYRKPIGCEKDDL